MNLKVVYYDLQTTDLNIKNKDGLQIVQFAAIHEDQILASYIFPTCLITKSATEIHGIYRKGNSLCLGGNNLLTVTPQTGLRENQTLSRLYFSPLRNNICRYISVKIIFLFF